MEPAVLTSRRENIVTLSVVGDIDLLCTGGNLRIVQGIAVGGEWGGAVLMAVLMDGRHYTDEPLAELTALAETAGARIVYRAREAVAELFGVPDPLRVCFGHNVTEALNLALRGLLRRGDHVVTSSIEHNSMMRPLRAFIIGRVMALVQR
mgnify:CR=1 FL=1